MLALEVAVSSPEMSIFFAPGFCLFALFLLLWWFFLLFVFWS